MMLTRKAIPYLVALLMIPIVVVLNPHALAASDGKAIFEQKCQSCHTIGGGRLVGPDLKDVSTRRDSDWLVSFITAPDKLIAQGDPIAGQLVKEYIMQMPNLGLSADDARAVLNYINAQSGAPAVTQSPPAAPVAQAATGDVSRGRDIFAGKTPLKNGGPSCLTCHNVGSVGIIGGGTVGKDLTTAYSALGETGISAILNSTPFPMMKEIYTAKPLTSDEIADVTAFLKEASSTQPSSGQNPAILFILSAIGALLVITLFQLLWRGRLAGVRRQLVKGGSK